MAVTGSAKDLSVASLVAVDSLPASSLKTASSISYVLSVEGQGVGEELDCFSLVRFISKLTPSFKQSYFILHAPFVRINA